MWLEERHEVLRPAFLGRCHGAGLADVMGGPQGVGVRVGGEFSTKPSATATEDLSTHAAVSASVPGVEDGS